jgi:hypothetical protein
MNTPCNSADSGRALRWLGAGLLALALCSAVPARADDKLLLAELPAGVDKKALMGIVSTALIGRRWTVFDTSADSVSAKIRYSNSEARIRIFTADNVLKYVDSTEWQDSASNQAAKGTPPPLPERWIYLLRSDISTRLDQHKRQAANEPSTRMQRLKELLDKGLITQSEYEKKRAEIVKSL